MSNVIAWNIRGLNWPNKQVDVHLFLQLNNVGLIGLLETKVKIQNVEKVAAQVFPGWRWTHNFSLNPKGRIWVAWKPSSYQVEVIHISEQYVHCKATQTSSNIKFFITYVYGLNQVLSRKQMWEDLSTKQPAQEPWCIIGDFNAILYKEDRIGGGEVLFSDIKDMQEFMENNELHEMKSIGPYYSWTNKTIKSRIDRALINEEWNAVFNYTQVRYEANSLSDHTPLMVQFLPSPKPKTRFQFCDMWARHADFHSIITSCLPYPTSSHKWRELSRYLGQVKQGLQQLNRRAFHDLKEQ